MVAALQAAGVNRSTGKWSRFVAGDRFVDTSNLNINVDEFDTIVDASGEGDYTTLQAAIDAGGVHIYVKNGTYTVTSSILIDNTDAVKKIHGQSKYGVIFNTTSAINVFTIAGTLVTSAGTSAMTQYSKSVAGTGTNYSTAGVVAGDFMQNNAASSFYDKQMYEIESVTNDTALVLKDAFFGYNTGSVAHNIVKPVKNLVLSNFTITHNNNTDATYPISMQYCYDVKVIDVVARISFNQDMGNILNSGKIVFDRCYFSKDAGNAISTLVVGGCGEVLFKQCHMKASDNTNTLDVRAINSSHVNYEDNNCMGVIIGGNGTSFITISHNKMWGGRVDLINVFGNNPNLIVANNVLMESYINTDGQSSEGTIIEGNYIYDPTSIAIYLNSVGAICQGNTILYGDSTGIQVGIGNGSFPCLIQDNWIAACTLAGIYVASGANGNIIKGNRSYSNATYGIQIAGGSNNVITNNELSGNTTAAILDSGTTTQKYLNRYTNSDVVYGMADYGVQGDLAITPITGIDAKTVATHNLFTVPTSRVFHVTKAIIRCAAATAITVAPTVGIGVAAGEDDIIPSQVLTGLDTAGKEFLIVVEGISVVATAGQIIKLGIDTGATGTSMTVEVILCGVLI